MRCGFNKHFAVWLYKCRNPCFAFQISHHESKSSTVMPEIERMNPNNIAGLLKFIVLLISTKNNRTAEGTSESHFEKLELLLLHNIVQDQ